MTFNFTFCDRSVGILTKGPLVYRITAVEKEKEHIYHSFFLKSLMCNINAEQAYLNILITINKIAK